MKRLLIALVICLVGTISTINAQYSASLNYSNVDWLSKNNKVLPYENAYFRQSFNFGETGLSIWQISCITKPPKSYELSGVDYSITTGNFKPRIGFHGYFPKESFAKYTDKGNFIPNIGGSYIIDSTKNITANVYQFWNYNFSSQFFFLNLVYKKTFVFGTIEMGQYYNFKIDALSGSISFYKNWQMYKKLFGFASIRWSFNESRTKQNEHNYIIVNVGAKI